MKLEENGTPRLPSTEKHPQQSVSFLTSDSKVQPNRGGLTDCLRNPRGHTVSEPVTFRAAKPSLWGGPVWRNVSQPPWPLPLDARGTPSPGGQPETSADLVQCPLSPGRQNYTPHHIGRITQRCSS